MDSGDTAWLMTSAALVLFMTPGLAFFYAGMVRSKNVLGMLMQNVFAMGIISLIWATIGFSLAFGGDAPLLGNLDYAFMGDIAGDEGMAFFAFQMMFAVITPALITGATADRLKFGSYAIFIAIWSIVVYSPVAHWVWDAGGWIFDMGAQDFAGGAAIHINAGIAALVIVAVLGERRGHGTEPMPPHNLPFTVLGTGILWFGWFGFNAGSALAANGVAAQALVNTHLAAAAGMLGWLVVEQFKTGHPTVLGACSGAVAGLVAITPCAGFVGGMSPIWIGLIAGAGCYVALRVKELMRLDDSLDVIAVHLVGGLIGTVLLGFFGDSAINGDGADGLFYGGGGELLKDQVLAALGVMLFSGVLSYVIAVGIDKTIGLRVDHDQELVGLDQSQHAESAYQA
ncbi:ammonium transporter [Ilumatobacter sp.]|uniref:ammonium transporter n=1 Tax=Ilumatobacter sp. TaxID=1967498 RepID=UPI003AF412BD